jgi:hypothetical protein
MATEYLVQFGTSAFVGRFDTGSDVTYARGQSVVVRTVRGEEVGTVLCPAEGRFENALAESAGTLLRVLTADDEQQRETATLLASGVLAAAERRAAEWPVSFVDAESTIDGSLVVLHVIPFAECDLRSLLDDLAAGFRTAVTLQDLSMAKALPDAPDATDGGCGKPDCGKESGGGCGTGGGCSTGSCSRGSVKSAEELTAYFVDLRQKMEADTAGRVALA